MMARIPRGLLSLLAVYGLAGCGDRPEISQCEQYVLGKLKAPSTYKRIAASGMGVPYPKPKQYTVTVEYDAANSFGVPIRETQVCVFPLSGDRPDTSKYIDFDGVFRRSAQDAANEIERNVGRSISKEGSSAPGQAGKPRQEPKPEVSVCYGDYCPCGKPEDALDRFNCGRIKDGLEPLATSEEMNAVMAIRGD